MWYLDKMTDAQKEVRKAALAAGKADVEAKKLVK